MNERSRLDHAQPLAVSRTATHLSHARSRAHSILTLRMTHPLHELPPSRLVIADLGGCERVAQVQLLLLMSGGIEFDA
jgi:hypothetical protein